MKRVEYHLLGNHLLANAKALVHAGLYFEGAEAERWRLRGLRIIKRQLREQVLPDGGHFERSTMYHAAVLEDLLDLVNLLHAYGERPSVDCLAAISSMRQWLRTMSHPDGEIAFFNDAAFDIAPKFPLLQAYAARLGLPALEDPTAPLVVLKSSGYVGGSAGPAYLICDCAPVGPDYLPGHAHADTLSFELSIAGQRVFVNSGTSEYGADVERQRQRGTLAHNTVTIDGHDSSEVWAGFRVARRARACLRIVSWQLPAAIEATHDGYSRLPGKNEHWRRWILDEQSLCIDDNLKGTFTRAEARMHLHPEIEARKNGPYEIVLTLSGRNSVSVVFDGAADVRIIPSTWHPRFGVSVKNRCIVARFSGVTLSTRIRWLVGL